MRSIRHKMMLGTGVVGLASGAAVIVATQPASALTITLHPIVAPLINFLLNIVL